MNWEIKYRKDAWKFISKNKLINKFEAAIKMFIKGDGRIDLKKLAGKLEGHSHSFPHFFFITRYSSLITAFAPRISSF